MTATDRAHWIDEYAPPPLIDPTTEWIDDLCTRTYVRCCPARALCRTDGEPRIVWCTRRNGHTGRHAAGNGRRIVAVWGQKYEPPTDPGEHPPIAAVRALLAVMS